MQTSATYNQPRLTVLHGKFAAYLAWSQPFIHHLIVGLERTVDNVVICNRTENLDRFPLPRIQRIDRRYLTEPTRAVVAANHLRLTYHPDVMHAHFGWSGIRMLLLKQLLRLPLVTTFGGRDVAVQMHVPEFQEVYRPLFAASEQLVCVSHDLKRQLLDFGAPPERVCVIHRGTNLHDFAFVDRSLRTEDASVQLLMVGRLVEKKGHRYALEALRALIDEGLKLHLTIVGEGEEYAGLRRLRRDLNLRDHVTLVPPTNHEGVRGYMRDADIFLHCSVTGQDGDTEGIPNVVVEAAAMGLPVIGTEHGGIVEPVRHGETGLLVKERDVAGLVQALRQLARERPLRLEMGRGGHRFMSSDFDLDKQIRSYREIYTVLVHNYREYPERRSQSWLPEAFDKKIDRALRASSNAVEFSVSELFEELTAPSDLSTLAMPKKSGRWARFYEIKRYIPHRIKFPIKMALRELLVSLLRFRSRWEGVEAIDPKEDLDDLVLRYFREGGDIETLLSDYDFHSMPRAKLFLSRALRNHFGLASDDDAQTSGT